MCLYRVLFGLFVALGVSNLIANSAGAGPLREKLKERWIKKQGEAPPPASSTDTDSKITASGDFNFTLNFDGRPRLYRVHVPAKYDSKLSTPLVLSLHGGGGDMEIQSTDKFYKWISKSEKETFIVVFPNGISPFPSGKLATWNAGHCCGGARDQKIDDVGFIREVVKRVSTQLNIDPKRIFATGMSNGAMMSYRLACELPETFRAIMAVAGTDNTVSCRAQSPVSVLHIHAKNDDHVLFEGGAGKGLPDKSKVTEFVAVKTSVAKWVKQNGCGETPKTVLEKAGARCELYAPCKAGTEVELCVTDKGAHSWPGGAKPRERSGEEPSTAISATDLAWDFFKSK